MKRHIAAIILVASFVASPAAPAVDIDLSGASMIALDVNTIKASHVAIFGVPGTYWANLRWSPQSLSFVVVDYGAEPLPAGVTWSFNVVDIGGAVFNLKLESDPANRALSAAYTWVSGSPFICPGGGTSFSQGNNQFTLSSFGASNSAALITWTTAFSGCGNIFSGQTVSATISQLPAWFDFNQSFAYHVNGASMVLNPDGTFHQ